MTFGINRKWTLRLLQVAVLGYLVVLWVVFTGGRDESTSDSQVNRDSPTVSAVDDGPSDVGEGSGVDSEPADKKKKPKTKQKIKTKKTKPETSGVKYAFPTVSRCPRCKSLQTVRTGQNGEIQYRKCTQVICKRGYSVTGKPV